MKALLNPGTFPVQNKAITIGGSKSESNRLLILQALFKNISIKNLSSSDDTKVLQKALSVGSGPVDVYHAGTAMRFLTAYFAAKEGTEVVLSGSSRMQERPIGILVDALRSLGANIKYSNLEGYPPLKITGATLKKNKVTIPSTVSSQYISALMLIAPILPRGLEIIFQGEPVSKPYIEMTLALLKEIGINASFENDKIIINPIHNLDEIEIAVESDWSSASYFYSLVALSADLKITLRNFKKKSLQGDSILPDIYKNFGVYTEFNTKDNSIFLSKVDRKYPDSLFLDMTGTPDLAQTVAVTCFGLDIGCNLFGLKTLRIKETDRLFALKNELTKLGAEVEIGKDFLQLEKGHKPKPNIKIDTYQDHRMAMAFAPLAIKIPIIIQDSGVVTKSYPGFWQDLKASGISCKFES